jgi:predicted  nucleic acid-binding Zn-ribbon protein
MKETSFNPKFKCCRYSLGPEFSGANRTLVPCTKNIDADAYVVDRLSWEKWMPSKNGLSKQQRRLTCLRKNLADRIAAGKLEEDYKQLQAHAQELSTHLKTSSSKGLELKQLLTQNQSSQDEINSLRVQLADAHAELATFTKGTEKPSPQLQEYVRGLELKVASVESELAKAKASDAELASLENECQALKEEVAALRVQLAAVSGSSIAMTPEVVAQKELLQSKVPHISNDCC